jgi:hypothetical protein
MALRYERPVKRMGVPTPTQRRSVSDREAEAYQRAKRRRDIARLAAATEGSLESKRQTVRTAMVAGLIAFGSTPARETIRRFEDMWTSGAQTVEDYYDDPRSGRPRAMLHSVIRAHVRQAVESGSGKKVRALWLEVQELAEALEIPQPSYYHVKREFVEAGRLARSAARHGRRAGEIDGMPHGRIPSRRTHDTWSLDELTVPVWAGQWDDVDNEWVSVRADMVLIIDVRSSAPVGYHIADPKRRRDESGRRMRGGCDSADILGTLLSAACPDLAPDATRDFAGYLPSRLRWDNASAHKELAAWIARDTTMEIDVRRIPKRRAISNGTAERRVQIVKHWMRGIRGHVDDYIPTDQIKHHDRSNQAKQRTAMSGGTSLRQPRKLPIEPAQLLTVEELRLEVDRIMRRYAYRHVNRVFGSTALARYHENVGRRPRNGLDLVRALTPRTTLVTSDGIVHYADGRAYPHYPVVDGTLFMLDTQVTYFADPLSRGIFVQSGDHLRFVPPSLELEGEEYAAQLARNQAFVARLASDQANKRREAEVVVSLGAQALDASKSAYHAELEAVRERVATNGAKPKALEPAQDIGPAPDCGSVDPWADLSPQSLVRRRSRPDDDVS